jgi:hypothetical protein
MEQSDQKLNKEKFMEARDWSSSQGQPDFTSGDPEVDAAKRVKKLIIEKSLTVSELSKRTGYSISYVSMVINGRRKNREVRDAIARALERNSQELWVGC